MNRFVKVLAMLMALMLCVGLTACSSKQGNGDAAVNYSLGLPTDRQGLCDAGPVYRHPV